MYQMGTQLPPKKMGAQHPHFSAHVYYGQTAGWIKMSLGMEVDLGPGHIVLDGSQLPPPERGTAVPLFSAHVYCCQAVARSPISATAELLLGYDILLLQHLCLCVLSNFYKPGLFSAFASFTNISAFVS